MSLDKDQKSRSVILEAAKEVFLKKGYDGARMQEIADKAGMNKALLHYYFSSKEALFDSIFLEAFGQFAPRINMEFNQYTNFPDFVQKILVHYIDVLYHNPHLPIFVLNELQRHPERPERLLRESGIKPEMLVALFQTEMEAGRIIRMDARELLVNILAMCIFPFAARPMMERILWDNNKEGYTEFLHQRAKTLFDFLRSTIFTDPDKQCIE